jgi:hypothetical protein
VGAEQVTEFISCATDSGRRKIVPGLLHKSYGGDNRQSFKMQIIVSVVERRYANLRALYVCSKKVAGNTTIISLLSEYSPR